MGVAEQHTAMAALVFCDLVDSTALGARLGETKSDELREAFFASLRGAVAAHRGDEVKNLGDGLMVAFSSVLDALACARAMQVGVARLGRELGESLSLRVGVSAGEASRSNGDWFGTPVVEAARLCAAAAPNSILVSDRAAALTMGRLDGTLRPIGELELKGLPAPLPAAELAWEAPQPPVRITLAGRIEIVGPAGTIGEDAFGGRQGRIVFALLVVRGRHQPLAKDAIADAVWGESLPPTWEAALRTVVSKVRRALSEAGLDPDLLTSAFGCYELRLPDRVTVDIDDALASVDQAGAALDHDFCEARRAVARAEHALALPVLAGEDGEWLDAVRAAVLNGRLRALEIQAEASLKAKDTTAALQAAETAIVLDPFRERAHRLLIAAHALAGSRGEALRAYERCRRILAEELGVRPSAATEAAYLDLLGEEPERETRTAAVRLPVRRSSFIGRDSERQEIADALAAAALVTLTGVGGVGKTRLAIQVATAVADRYPDGVWFVDLSTVRAADEVAAVVANTIGAAVPPGTSPNEAIADFVRAKRSLVVLDNCEHVIDVAARLADLIVTTAPASGVLATSRERLAVDGERVVPIRPLAAQDALKLLDERAGGVEGDEAVRLELCRRLDHLPLAIELAATRLASMDAVEILSRLDRRLKVLTTGSRTASPRHQTLRDTVEWSYDLLDETERTLLRRLAAFAGEFDLAAVRAVAPDATFDEGDAVDVLGRLVDKSLTVVERGHGGRRYRLLESIREYAEERLAEAGEVVDVRRRHAAYYLQLTAAAGDQLSGPRELDGHDTLARERANIRVAMAQALDSGATELVMTALGELGWHRLAEGEKLDVAEWTARAVDLPGAADHRDFEVVCATAGMGAWWTRADIEANSRFVELPLARGGEETNVHPLLLCAQGNLRFFGDGETAATLEFSTRAVDAARQLNDPGLLSYTLANLAMSLTNEGEANPAAIAVGEEAVEAATRSGSPSAAVFARFGLGRALGNIDPRRAVRVLEEATAAPIRNFWTREALATIALFSQALGDDRRAAALLRAVTEECRTDGDRVAMMFRVEGAAQLLAHLGRDEPAVVLEGVVIASGRGLQDYTAEALRQAHDRLSLEQLEELLTEGHSLSVDDAVQLALDEMRDFLAAQPAARLVH